MGNNITLPCHMTPVQDVSDQMIEWSKLHMEPRFVHVRRSGEDRLVDQNPEFSGRTSMSLGGLTQGDASLTLFRVRLSDEGTYRCFVPSLRIDTKVQLHVEATIVLTTVGSRVLDCSSSGWYSEPEVSWMDAEGHLVSAGPPETVRGPDELYTVNSRVTVDKRHGSTVTCRVHQDRTNQTREAQIQVPDDFFIDDSSGSSKEVVIGATFGLLCALTVVLIALWKWKHNKAKSENLRINVENQSRRGSSETHRLIETNTEEKETVEEKGNSQELHEETGFIHQTQETTGTNSVVEIVSEQKREDELPQINEGTQSPMNVEGQEEQSEEVSEDTEQKLKKEESSANEENHQEESGRTTSTTENGGKKEETEDEEDRKNQSSTETKGEDQLLPEGTTNKETADSRVDDENGRQQEEEEEETAKNDDKQTVHDTNAQSNSSEKPQNEKDSAPEKDHQCVKDGPEPTDTETQRKGNDQTQQSAESEDIQHRNDDHRPKAEEEHQQNGQTDGKGPETSNSETSNKDLTDGKTQDKDEDEQRRPENTGTLDHDFTNKQSVYETKEQHPQCLDELKTKKNEEDHNVKESEHEGKARHTDDRDTDGQKHQETEEEDENLRDKEHRTETTNQQKQVCKMDEKKTVKEEEIKKEMK